jgi:hypothetical protein
MLKADKVFSCVTFYKTKTRPLELKRERLGEGSHIFQFKRQEKGSEPRNVFDFTCFKCVDPTDPGRAVESVFCDIYQQLPPPWKLPARSSLPRDSQDKARNPGTCGSAPHRAASPLGAPRTFPTRREAPHFRA